jgi:cation:H+ antiporter
VLAHLEQEIWLALPALVLGILAIVRGGDWFVDASCEIAVALNVPKIVIGATIVSLSTTLPEATVSLIAHVWTGNTDIALGNVVGSVICNSGLILGTAVFIVPLVASRPTVIYQIVFLMLALVAVSAFAVCGIIPRWGGFLLLAGLLAYLVYSVRAARRYRRAHPLPVELSTPVSGTVFRFILGVGLVLIGSRILVAGAIGTATYLGVPELIISLTLVALGTSLPELVTSIAAVIKRHGDLSLGNILGANILNLFLVLGACSAVKPLAIAGDVVRFDLPAMIVFSVLMSVCALTGGRLTRWEGALLLGCYLVYLVSLGWRILL